MPKQVSKAGALQMTKVTTELKPGNGKPLAGDLAIAKTILQVTAKPQEPKPVLIVEPAPVIPAEIAKKEMTLVEKLLKVENLHLVVEKRTKLVQTRSDLERFQVSSNDFNCTLKLTDSDGNSFITAFTPGIKKVIEMLKNAFDASIQSVEDKIIF